jgi:hypothetical protein
LTKIPYTSRARVSGGPDVRKSPEGEPGGSINQLKDHLIQKSEVFLSIVAPQGMFDIEFNAHLTIANSLSIMDLTSMPPLHHLLAYSLPVFWLGVFLGIMATPEATCKSAGFALPPGKRSPFLYLFAARELGMSVMAFLMIAYDEWRGLTILFGSALIFGTADTIVDGMMGEGWGHGLKSHGLPTLMAAWAVRELAKEFL